MMRVVKSTASGTGDTGRAGEGAGKQQKILKRHLAVAHDLTPAAYRELFDLKSDYPMIAPSYAEQRSELAKRIGLGRKEPPRPERMTLAACFLAAGDGWSLSRASV